MLALVEWTEVLANLLAAEDGVQTNVAVRLDVTPQSVQEWVAGDSFPGPENQRKIAVIYDVDAAQLADAINRAKLNRSPRRTRDDRITAIEGRLETLAEQVAYLLDAYPPDPPTDPPPASDPPAPKRRRGVR